jgi:hypothetical protein
MLLRVRMAAAARLAAVLVAATLTGAPRVLALNAPMEGHRCSCAAHGDDHHRCACAVCRKAALAARASDGNAPPCHRAAARKALSEARGRSGPSGTPCVEGTCGGPGQAPAAPGGPEPFSLPSHRPIARTERAERLPVAAAAASARPLEPETPPPRAA